MRPTILRLRRADTRVRALLFDFDGTLWDCEAPIFSVYSEIYAALGHELSIQHWWTVMGTLGFDPWAPLEQLIGAPVDRGALDAVAVRRTKDLLSRTTARAGVRRLIADADRLGLRRAIVSNNSHAWVERYAYQCGVGDGWSAIATADGDSSRAKPKPDLYLAALERLRVGPKEALAFEDSTCGLRAATSAGIRCVVVAHGTTQRSALGAADRVLDSFEDLELCDLLL